MKKIPTLFKRDHQGSRLVYNEVTVGAEWVIQGEGVATAKLDGTCCLVRDGTLYKRYEVKQGKAPPALFEPAQDPDPVTGKQPGWVPVGDGPEDQWHREALENYRIAWRMGLVPTSFPAEGTYELVGPKIQGNPHELGDHQLYPHAALCFGNEEPLRTFAGVRAWLEAHRMEGVVWHHPDGRMVKIKRRDFGLPWGGERE